LSGFGRVKRADGSVARPLYFEGAPDNPGMYTINISSKPEKKLVYIQFRNVSPGTNRESNRAFIFAVSGFLVAPIEVKPAPIKEEIIPSEKKVPEEIRTTKPVEEKVIPITPKTFIIDGTVRDAKTEKPVRAIVNFIGTKTLSLSSDEDGLFSAEFPDLSEYTVKIEAAGYMGVTEKINLNQLPTRKMNVTMVPIEVGTLVKLNNILFEQSSPKLKEASFQELDQVADFLKNNPAVSIKLAGHTDNRGDRKLNLKLSKDRVAEVKKYLIMKGIDAGRITGQGYGGSKPIARGNNEEAWKLNRRVEFTITKM
jgi:outer membrane protein OmpA-like peptidoglycan-associated protein